MMGPRPIALILGMILLIGAIFRFWALDFGAQILSRPDEQHISQAALFNILQSFFAGSPSLNPHFFHYSSFYIYLISILYALYYLAGHLLGIFPSSVAFLSGYYEDWSSYHLILRATSALFGVCSIGAIYALGKRLFQSTPAGLLSSALLAVTYLHVRDSHFGVTDIPMTFWVILCLYWSLRAYDTRQKKDLLIAGALAGLAASTKYPAGLVSVAVWMAYWLPLKEKGHSFSDIVTRPPILLSALQLLGCIGAGFLLFSPYVLLDFPSFYRDFQYNSGLLLFSNVGGLEKGWLYHLKVSFWQGVGPLYFLTALAGIVWALWGPNKQRHWILLVFASLFYLVIGNSKYVFVRYMLPLIPILAVYASGCLVLLVQRLQALAPANRLSKTWILGLLALLVSGSSLWHSGHFLRVAAQEDTRSQAKHWLLKHTHPEDAVGIGLVLAHVDMPPNYRKYFLAPPKVKAGTEGGQTIYLYSPKAEYTTQPNTRNELNISTYSDVSSLQKMGISYVAVGLYPHPI